MTSAGEKAMLIDEPLLRGNTMEDRVYQGYLDILKEELLPAMGCTEPVSVAYAAALARHTLGALPSRAEISVSGNILKNVKSVIVPNTGGLKGVAAAAAAGIVAGDHTAQLQVISGVTDAQREEIRAFLSSAEITVKKSDSGCIFDIGVRVDGGGHTAYARIEGHHTFIAQLERDGKPLIRTRVGAEDGKGLTDRSILSVKGAVEFADQADLDDISPLISRQIEYNSAIAEEGLKNDYGARVGKILLSSYGTDVHTLARATAAAGSDARMNGCGLPVVIVSGSGNQGITACMPVVVYAKHLGSTREQLIRAVAVADLVTIHLKTGIGRLSAYCGAVSAGAGAGAGIAYLYGGRFDEVAHTVVNALAITSGLICDGAKSSCAAKISSAVDAGLTGMEMYRNGSQFFGGDGILESGVESTIDNVGDLARVGMRETDEEIIRLMIKNL